MGKYEQGCDPCHKSPDFDNPESLCFSCHHCADIENVSRCLNCHEPHGTSGTIGLLKKKWVVNETARWSSILHRRDDDCLTCHHSRPRNKTSLNLKFAEDINLLCRDCHAQATCGHPVGITIPGYMKKSEGLNLDNNKRIICTTCHRLNCQGDGSIAFMGFSRKNGLQTNELCYQCHQPQVKNPHNNVYSRRNCRTCHAFVRQENKLENDYTFLTDPRMVCLRCHPDRPHPAGDDHRHVFPLKEKLVMKNFHLDSFGRITCTSCHRPHTNPRLFCITNVSCIDCHRKYF